MKSYRTAFKKSLRVQLTVTTKLEWFIEWGLAGEGVWEWKWNGTALGGALGAKPPKPDLGCRVSNSLLKQGSHSRGKSGRVRELIWSGKVGKFCWWPGNFGSLRTKMAIFVYVSGQSSYWLV